MKKSAKSILGMVALMLVVMATTSCITILHTKAYPNVKFKVVDAETGQPIEGAVLLVSWLKLGPFVTTVSKLYREDTVLSDENGIFAVPGVFSTALDRPELAVYKRGYVG